MHPCAKGQGSNNYKDMITICVGIYNRSFSLINFLIPSMNKCEDSSRLALSVYDCGSTDIEDLRSKIEKLWKGTLIFRCEKRRFSRSYAFNQAIYQAPSNKVFRCDADMSLPHNFVKLFDRYVTEYSVWFPICFSLYKNKPLEIKEGNGWWRGEGHGMVGIWKENFELLGGFNEKFKQWGQEDDDLFVRAHLHFKVFRDKCYGLFHHWHPPDEDSGGRHIDESSIATYERLNHDPTVRSRNLYFNFASKLILSGEREMVRASLKKNIHYSRFCAWWKLWFAIFLPNFLFVFVRRIRNKG